MTLRSGRSLHSLLIKEKDPGVLDLLQLWQVLHRQNQEETGNQAEGIPARVLEEDFGGVSGGRTCIGEPPSHRIGGSLSG